MKTNEELARVAQAYREQGSKTKAAASLGMPWTTYKRKFKRAVAAGLIAGSAPAQPAQPHDDAFRLRQRISRLESDLLTARKESLSTDQVRQFIFQLRSVDPTPPDWLMSAPGGSGVIGVPVLCLGDFHWAEYVDPAQIEGLNEYSLEIAQARLRRVVERTVDLLTQHMVNPQYPGIVVPLLGDMLSGDIHLELVATNESPVPPAMVDLLKSMVWALTTLADHFGRVFVPAVAGNHGRLSVKPQAKNSAFSNWDWLLYTLLEHHFQAVGDDRVRFLVSAGEDVEFQVYGHKYRASHGAQFRGGDGIIGPLGPITRGDNKKRGWTSQTGRQYDVSIYGHFHRLITLSHMVANGSLKGYDEYAYKNNFPFEPPRQALFIVHPRRGITFQMPVYADQPEAKESRAWVAWPEGE